MGFESPFTKELNGKNRWIKLAAKIPLDSLVGVYNLQMNNWEKGVNGLNPWVAIGAIIINHICDLSDRENI